MLGAGIGKGVCAHERLTVMEGTHTHPLAHSPVSCDACEMERDREAPGLSREEQRALGDPVCRGCLRIAGEGRSPGVLQHWLEHREGSLR